VPVRMFAGIALIIFKDTFFVTPFVIFYAYLSSVNTDMPLNFPQLLALI
jgi:hypothetical protein